MKAHGTPSSQFLRLQGQPRGILALSNSAHTNRPPNQTLDKDSRQKVTRSQALHFLFFKLVYTCYFFHLGCSLDSGLRNPAQDLMWVSLFKCPNPCKGLVSSCVHFAQY